MTREAKSARGVMGYFFFSTSTHSSARRRGFSRPWLGDLQREIPRACGRRQSSPCRVRPAIARRLPWPSHKVPGWSVFLSVDLLSVQSYSVPLVHNGGFAHAHLILPDY